LEPSRVRDAADGSQGFKKKKKKENIVGGQKKKEKKKPSGQKDKALTGERKRGAMTARALQKR